MELSHGRSIPNTLQNDLKRDWAIKEVDTITHHKKFVIDLIKTSLMVCLMQTADILGDIIFQTL